MSLPPSEKSQDEAHQVLQPYIGEWPQVSAEYQGLVDLVALQLDAARKEERDLICEDLRSQSLEYVQISTDLEGAELAMYESIASVLDSLSFRYGVGGHKAE